MRRELLIALNASDRITRPALCRLATRLDDWCHDDPGPRAGRRSTRDLARALGVPGKQLDQALGLRAGAGERAAAELALAEDRGCRILTLLDDDYPRPLLDHPLPPPVLYCRGGLPTRPAVAIVGSRRMSSYGREAATLFARALAAAGLTIVSGFALGVDATAHRAALEAENGTTVAVLGCGIDVNYPRAHADLGDQIARRGAILSEFPLGAEPLPWRFPIRNRLIAALAVGTLVVQATPRSGSLITAHQALELGRDVYAVPGRIFDPSGMGTNALLADGALVARAPEDILDSLRIGQQRQLFPELTAAPSIEGNRTASRHTQVGTGPAEARGRPRVGGEPGPAPRTSGFPGQVLEAMSDSGSTAEEIAAAVGRSVDRVLGTLLELELQGRVRRQPGPVYCR